MHNTSVTPRNFNFKLGSFVQDSDFAKNCVQINMNGEYIVIHEELLLFMSENKRLSAAFM